MTPEERATWLAEQRQRLLEEEQQQRGQAVKNVALNPHNPAEMARAKRLADTFGVSPALVQAEPEVFDAKKRQQDTDTILTMYPWMTPLLQDQSVAAMMSPKDLPAVGEIGTALGMAPPKTKPMQLGGRDFTLPDLRGTPLPAPAPVYKRVPWKAKDYLTRLPAAALGAFGTAVTNTAQGVLGAMEFGADITGFDDETQAYFDREREIGNKTIENLRPEWMEGNFVQESIFGGVSSTIQMLLPLPFGKAAILPTLAGTTGFSAYGKYETRGATMPESIIGGVLEGGIEYATERLPLQYLTGNKFLKGGASDFVRNFVISDVIGEQIATLGQDAVDTAIANPDKTWADYWEERPQAAAGTLIATLTTSALVGGGRNVLQRFSKTIDDTRNGVEAMHGQAILDGLMERAANVDLRTAAPEEFAKFIEEGAKNSPVKNIYVPIEAVEAALQDESIPEEERSVLTLYQDQINEARLNGSDVVIPIGEATARLAGTKLWQSIREDTRVLAGGLSGREAKEKMDGLIAELEQIGNEAFDEARTLSPAISAKAAVYDEVKAQVLAAGRGLPEAQTTAVLLASRAENLASERYGKFKDATEAWKWMQLKIVGPDAAIPKGKRTKLAQSAFADVPNLLQRNDWAIVTAENPDAKQLSPEENAARQAELKSTLDAMGLKYTVARGVYDNEEAPLAIDGITEQQAQELGRRFGQDSVLTRSGFVYSDGRIAPARSVIILDKDADNYFTELPDGTKFQIDIDFENVIPAPEVQTLQQAALPDKDVPSSVGGALDIARSRHFPNIREFKIAIQKAVKANKSNLRDRKRIIRLALNDARQALQSNANAIGWYNDKMVHALEVFSAIHPEIATDENSKFAFVYALAVTSNGLKVNANFKLADKVYREYKKTGQMPVIGEGTAGGAMEASLALFNTLMERHGLDAMRDFMTRRTVTVKEVEAFTGTKVTGEHKTTAVTGAAFLGPKIGNGFFANLYGNYDQLTMDRWFIRTWGRWTGTLITESPAKAKAKRETVKNILRGLTATQRKKLDALLSTKRDPFTSKLTDIDGFAKRLTVATSKKPVRDALKEIDPTDRLRLDTKALHVLNDGQKEAPDGPKERNEIRSIMVPMLQELKQDNPDLTMADLQALLWYPEKTLYDTARAKVGIVTAEGYENDEAPDYANAAVALARSEGISEEKINAATQRADRRLAAAKRAGRTERGAGEVHAITVAEDGRGFPAEDGLVSDGAGTMDPMVLQQFGGRAGAANVSGVISKLYRAEDMEAAGRSPEDIWNLTGWTRDVDGMWRFEIDDSEATLGELPSGDVVSMNDVTPGIDYDHGTPTMGANSDDGALMHIGAWLDQVYQHPKLYQHYPLLKQVKVFHVPLGKGVHGFFDGYSIVLNADRHDADEKFSTIIHEVQHAIQAIEGFTNGTSPELEDLIYYGLYEQYEAQLKYLTAINNKEVEGWAFPVELTPEQLEARAAYDVYAAVLGEVEARNAQKRQKLTKRQRREQHPDRTADVQSEYRLVPLIEPMRLAAQSADAPQGPTRAPRGEASFYPNGRTTVQLFAKADFSTMLHEMSHVFLQQEFTLAQEASASPELKADIEKLTKWFEANGGALVNGMPDTAAHELFARTGERYFREGKAPSAELRSAFKQFRSWLLGVYKSMKDLLAYGPAPINPEIREIMDRMLATEEAISANAITPLSQEELGMSDDEYAAYMDSVSTARDDAFDILLERMMKAIRQRETSKMRELRGNIRAEVADVVNAEPRFIALHLLRTGRWLGDPTREASPIKLNTGWLIDNYGEEVLSLLPVGLQPIHRGDGVVGDVVADMVGFRSGNDLVQALLALKQEADQLKKDGNPRPLRDQIIEDQVDQRMAELHGDIAMSEEEIEEEAIAALNANRQGEVLAAELRQLKKKASDERPGTPYQLLREWARRKVNEGTVDEAVSKSALQRYIRGFNKARNLFEQALLSKDAKEAIKQKQAQMINHALLSEGKKVADEINTIIRRMKRYASVKAMASIDQDYMDRIHELLEGYNFRNVSDVARAEKASFEVWAEKQREQGHEVFVPERFRDERTNWKDARVTKLLELNDMVQSLVAQGKLKQRLTNAKAERELAATIDEVESRILQLPVRKLPEASTGEANRPFRQAIREGDYRAAITNLFSRKKIREGVTGLLKVEGLMDILDGVKDATGPLNQIVVQGATDAANHFSNLMEEVMAPLVELYKSMPKKQSARLRDFVTINELSLNVSIHEADSEKLGQPLTITRMQLLGLILNTGNLSNLSKLVGGERWGDHESATDMARVRDILVSYASKEDMDLVQSLWDGVGKLWPHIAEVERQLSGIVPEQVVPVEFDTPHGRYSGGYWPVVWDSTRSEMGRRQGEEAETSLQGVGFGISTPKGHTITRTGAVAPMEWSVENVLFNHLNKVISRISYAPWVRDVLKVVDNPRVTGAIRLRLGNEYVSALKPWIRDQIPANAPDTLGAKAWEKFLDQFRINMSISVLGISYTTGVAQALGLGYSAGVLGEGSVKAGGRWVAQGMYEMIKLQKGKLGGAQEFVFARSTEMQRRAQELNQEVTEVFNKLRDKDTLYNKLQAAAFWHIGFIDLNMVSLPTWLGGYHKGLKQGLSDDEASAYADKMVRLSQGSGRKKDMAAIQRGTAGQKFISMFYTPSSVFFNQQWEAAQHLKAGNWSKALAPTFWFLVATTIADAMREGDWPEDDDDDGLGLGDITEWVGRNLLFGAFYGIPVVRDVTNAAERKMRGEYAEYGSTPISALASTVERGAKSGKKIATGEDFEGKDVKNAVSAMGYLLGLPGSQIGKTSGYIKDVYDGKVEPETPYDWYHGLAYGKPPADS